MAWDDIKKSVEDAGNVLTVTMEELREACGAGRLGIHVRSTISSTLAGMGLGHVPQDLPINQHDSVRLYKRGTPVGEFIETVLKPSQMGDRILAEKFSDQGPDYASVIEAIRALVAE
jgi:hypothetical protein